MDGGMSTVWPLRDSVGQTTLRVRTQRALKVFVTGGNGFIGSVVVRLLHAAGHTVRVLVRPAANTERIDAIPVERVVGDVRDTLCCGGHSMARTPSSIWRA